MNAKSAVAPVGVFLLGMAAVTDRLLTNAWFGVVSLTEPVWSRGSGRERALQAEVERLREVVKGYEAAAAKAGDEAR